MKKKPIILGIESSCDETAASVIQENDSIPNPPSDYKIRQGDYLLCYGKLSSLKSYLKRHKTNVRIRSM